MAQAALLSMAAAWIAFTVADAALFAPLRRRARSRGVWLGRMLSCGHCLAFWIALALVGLYRLRLFAGWPLLDHLLTALVIAWLSSFQVILLCWLIERAGK
jgi:hypothetical protein